MQLLHATGAEIASPLTGSYMDLVGGENVSIKAAQELIDHVLASNPNPAERVRIGNKLSCKLVLAAASFSTITTLFGTIDQTVVTLTDKDVKFKILETDGSYSYITLSDMNVTGDLDMTMQQGDRYYLPVECQSTNTSEMSFS